MFLFFLRHTSHGIFVKHAAEVSGVSIYTHVIIYPQMSIMEKSKVLIYPKPYPNRCFIVSPRGMCSRECCFGLKGKRSRELSSAHAAMPSTEFQT